MTLLCFALLCFILLDVAQWFDSVRFSSGGGEESQKVEEVRVDGRVSRKGGQERSPSVVGIVVVAAVVVFPLFLLLF